jgi:hypothetical protein
MIKLLINNQLIVLLLLLAIATGKYAIPTTKDLSNGLD